MEHRRAKAMIEASAHVMITPIKVLFAIEERREVIKFLNKSPSESLLKVIVAIRKIWAAYSYCEVNLKLDV